MDHFLYKYSYKLYRNNPEICTHNCFKRQFIRSILPLKSYNRAKYLMNQSEIQELIPGGETFYDEESTYSNTVKKLIKIPKYVLKEIENAIYSINIRPMGLMMTSVHGKYILHVKYDNKDILHSIAKATVELKYTFRKKASHFVGYFGKKALEDDRLPLYEIVNTTPQDGSEGSSSWLLRVMYNFDSETESSLEVYFKQDGKFNINSDIIDCLPWVPDDLQMTIASTTLIQAVFKRIFPTKAHIAKLMIDQLVRQAKNRFYDQMELTLIDWDSNPKVANLCAAFMIKCFTTKRTRPILGLPVDVMDIPKAKKLLHDKYPFLIDQTIGDGPNECYYDIWTCCFKREICSRIAHKMNLSRKTIHNLETHFFKDPDKYHKLIQFIRPVRNCVAKADFKYRTTIARTEMNRLKLTDEYMDQDVEFVIKVNRIKSVVPIKYRLYPMVSKTNGTVLMNDETSCKHISGNKILERKSKYIPPKTLIDEINYFDVGYENPPPLFRLMEKINLLAKITLMPTSLEKRFEKYTFSSDYRIKPTVEDCLAVRYANVYKDTKYKVPKVPQDFYERFGSDLQLDLDNAQENHHHGICITCWCGRKDSSFPCGHLCICERCSLYMLKCPICGSTGEPYKMYI